MLTSSDSVRETAALRILRLHRDVHKRFPASVIGLVLGKEARSRDGRTRGKAADGSVAPLLQGYVLYVPEVQHDGALATVNPNCPGSAPHTICRCGAQYITVLQGTPLSGSGSKNAAQIYRSWVILEPFRRVGDGLEAPPGVASTSCGVQAPPPPPPPPCGVEHPPPHPVDEALDPQFVPVFHTGRDPYTPHDSRAGRRI